FVKNFFSSLCRLAFNLTTVKYITCTLLFSQIFLLVRIIYETPGRVVILFDYRTFFQHIYSHEIS
ncbi:MAG: hypothetical protein H9806_08570, partial [Candidatus Lactobacillus pullistercoris]|nr:hypothetical protein [Candidatus Lactobacillus pullistercoris]